MKWPAESDGATRQPPIVVVLLLFFFFGKLEEKIKLVDISAAYIESFSEKMMLVRLDSFWFNPAVLIDKERKSQLLWRIRTFGVNLRVRSSYSVCNGTSLVIRGTAKENDI